MLGQSPDIIDEVLTDAFDRVRIFFKVNCCGLLKINKDEKDIRITLNSCEDPHIRRIIGEINLAPLYPSVCDDGIDTARSVVLIPPLHVPPDDNTINKVWKAWKDSTLCIVPIDTNGGRRHYIGLWGNTEDQHWPPEYPAHLVMLGDIFLKFLTLNDYKKRIIKNEYLIDEIRHISQIGTWEWDLIAGNHYWSKEVYPIFGMRPEDAPLTERSLLFRIHPDDRVKVKQAIEDLFDRDPGDIDLQYRLIRDDGTERTIRVKGRVVHDAAGKPARLLGIIMDTTATCTGKNNVDLQDGPFGKLEEMHNDNVHCPGKNIGNIVIASEAIRQVIRKIEQVAEMDTTVIFMGETGTGKGVFARVLHEISHRTNHPFVQVNCAGLPASLIESELFGHEKGAFTGATDKQIGRFELANGGTIFLDEIGELTLDLQSKLLKVIRAGSSSASAIPERSR